MSKYEEKILQILNKQKIKYIREKTFEDLKGGKYRYDFYLPNLQGAPAIIEMDGEQHFTPVYGEQALKLQQEHDRQKNSYALANKIKLYRVPFWQLKDINKFSDIINKKFLVTSRWHNDFMYREYLRGKNG